MHSSAIKSLKKRFSLRATNSTGDSDDSNLDESHRSANVNSLSYTSSSTETNSILRPPQQLPERPPTPPSCNLESQVTTDFIQAADKLSDILEGIMVNDMDLLLAQETQARMDHQDELTKRRKEEEERKKAAATRIKFALPDTPPVDFGSTSKEESSSKQNRRRMSFPDIIPAKFTKRRWSHRSSDSSALESTGSSNSRSHLDSLIVVGWKVLLFKKPLPLVGIVRYVGRLEGELEEWVGVELDSAVGTSDGVYNGKRYFKTNPQCALFVKKSDVKKI